MENLFLAYALIFLGLVLMAAEVLLPTGGILFVLGIGGLIAGLAMTFSYSATQGLVTTIVVFVLIPILGPVLVHYWPKTVVGRKFFLAGPDEDATVASMPTHIELEQLRGRYGKTVSSLRPAGVTEFDGRRVDTMSEGSMIAPGEWVRCIEVKAGTVIVRQVEKPPDLADLNPSDLQ